MKIYVQLLVIAAGFCFVQTSFAQDPAKQWPDKYKVIFENNKMRVLDVHLKPGGKSPMHSHPNYLVYSFTNGSVKFMSKEHNDRRQNESRGLHVAHAESHAVENPAKPKSTFSISS